MAASEEDPWAGHRTPTDDPSWGWEFRLEEFVIARLGENSLDLPEVALANLKALVARHSNYVHREHGSMAQCMVCPGTEGFPCVTLRMVSDMWQDHPDHPYRGHFGHPYVSSESLFASLYEAGSHYRDRNPGIGPFDEGAP